MNKIKEEYIEKKLTKFYKKEKKYVVKNQVWFSQKRIDIVIKDGDDIIAVEVKIYDWKNALRQANLNKIFCHKSYVAIWHTYAHRAEKQKEFFENNGIGLISIDEDFSPREIIEPSKQKFVNNFAYNYVLNRL